MESVSNRKKTVLIVACIIVAVFAAVFVSSVTFKSEQTNNSLQKQEEPSVKAEWLGLLADDQKSTVDKAYEQDVDSGYEGTEDEWFVSHVKNRGKGDDIVTLVLPDGSELDVEIGTASAMSDKKVGEQDSAESYERVPLEQWYDVLADDQLAAIDIAYEQSVADGWQGTKDDWLASEVKAQRDHAGDVLVMLPDGGEFVVDKHEFSVSNDTAASAENADGQKNADSGDNAQTPNDESGASIIIQNAKAEPNQSDLAVAVSIERNPGILGLALSVSYDEEALILKGAENGEALKDVLTMTHSKGYASGCVFAWDGVEVRSEDVKDGTILTLYFDIAPGTKSGTYPITVQSEGTAVNNDLQEVAVFIHDGSVTVE